MTYLDQNIEAILRVAFRKKEKEVLWFRIGKLMIQIIFGPRKGGIVSEFVLSLCLGRLHKLYNPSNDA